MIVRRKQAMYEGLSQKGCNMGVKVRNQDVEELEYELKQLENPLDANKDVNNIVKEELDYKALFEKENSIKDICANYFEGLEWVFKYYMKGCSDWKWKYNYHYPPLFVDLIKYVPHFASEFIVPNTNAPFSPYAQLSYVLPPEQLSLLPEKIRNYLFKTYPKLTSQMEFQWAFCRYFWEAHVNLPHIEINELEAFVAKGK
jgi:5'-3' exonuclease